MFEYFPPLLRFLRLSPALSPAALNASLTSAYAHISHTHTHSEGYGLSTLEPATTCSNHKS